MTERATIAAPTWRRAQNVLIFGLGPRARVSPSINVTGSHYILHRPARPNLRVTVAYHNRDIRPSTLRSIIRQAGLSIDECIDLL